MADDPLITFFSLDQPRRIRVIQNVLEGRKTVSNLFWGMRYQLLGYFKVFSQIPPQFNDQSLLQLVNNGNLLKNQSNMYSLTANGDKLATNLNHRYQISFNKNKSITCDVERFTSRFNLANQVISEFSYHSRNYYPVPVTVNDTNFVKSWFHYYKNNRIVTDWFNFIQTFTASLGSSLALQFVNSMVGYQKVGQTIEQQSQTLNLDPVVLTLRHRLIFNQLLNTILNSDSELFRSLLTNIEDSLLTPSARQTLQLVFQGQTFQQIANYRKLRISTIKEHVLEMAILIPYNHKFRFLVAPENFKYLQNYSATHPNVDNWNYAIIKGSHPEISFFEFRLCQILRSKQDG